MSALTAPIHTTPVVTVRNLTKSYGTKEVLRGIDCDIYAGEIFGILGPSGAGKSTTVECLAGLRTQDSGEIRVLGLNPVTDGKALPTILGIQFQDANLPDSITVLEVLTMFASCYDTPADVEYLISMLGLEEKRKAPFGSLSGGQKQRVSIALALVGNPRVVILDELTTGLDPVTRRQTWELVKNVRDSGVTVILVSHLMDEVEYLADRLVILDQGVIQATGSPAELIAATDGASNLEDVFFARTSALDHRCLVGNAK
ncbi:MAG: ABC transporter ATP-binding protein [Cellulomonadaceae bacterium]|jgi:ABC-2 type transport system ATP-binding protein|nr:ABC transporter ATP-binding protein [Cellulomonadaceae bacterium]